MPLILVRIKISSCENNKFFTKGLLHFSFIVLYSIVKTQILCLHSMLSSLDSLSHQNDASKVFGGTMNEWPLPGFFWSFIFLLFHVDFSIYDRMIFCFSNGFLMVMKLSFWSPGEAMEAMFERMVTGAFAMLTGLVTSLTGLPVKVVKLWMFICNKKKIRNWKQWRTCLHTYTYYNKSRA